MLVMPSDSVPKPLGGRSTSGTMRSLWGSTSSVPPRRARARRPQARPVGDRGARRDRRELIRRYKETPRTMGVYQVRNTRSGRCLIGASVDVPSMLNRVRAQLRMNGHPDRELQQDWETLGVEAFTFDVLDTLDPTDEPDYDPSDDLSALELLWAAKLEAEGVVRYRGHR